MYRILKTANFRLAILYAAVFSISVFLLGLIVFYSTTSSMEEHIRQRIEAESNQLMGDYKQDGIEELRHDIRERINADPINRLYYYLKSPQGKIIFDDIDGLPEGGWNEIALPSGEQLILYVNKIDDGYSFAVAGSLNSVMETEQTIKQSFFVAFIFALFFGLIGGAIISSRFLARVDNIARTAEIIGNGQLKERIRLTGANDDFDQLASIINGMLDKIESLVSNIKQVSSNIAHDLRTPLSHIRQKLEGMKGSQNQREIDEVIALVDNVIDIFASMLRIAEIEAGERKKGFADVNLSEIVHNIAETYAVVAQESGKQLEITVEDVVHVEGDKDLLMQLVVNLIENAILHNPPNTVIRIELSDVEHGKLVVSDSGEGVPAEELENITKAFYRVDKSRKTKGTGLGLSLVKVIADLHNAALSFEDNNPGLKVVVEFK